VTGHIKLIFLLALVCWSSIAVAATLATDEVEKHLKSENRAIIFGEKNIDFGEFDKSNQVLAEAVKRFPKNDMIAALYGKSLYESGDKDRAEEYFMHALRLNAANILAQQYIEQIREVRSLSESEESQEWTSIMKDKIGDLIVFVLSIWLGTSANSIWQYFSRRRKWSKAQQCYKQDKFGDVVRILESHVVEMDQDAINECLDFMGKNKNSENPEEVRKILKDFVIREEDLKVLMRSLDLLESKPG